MFNDADCLRILEEAMSTTADFAEVFQEVTESKSVSLLNGQVIRAATGFDSGTGIRLLAGTNSVYVYSSDNDLEVLLKLAKEAAAAIKGNDKGQIAAIAELCRTSKAQIKIDPMSTPKSDMVDFLRKSSDFALGYDPLITQVAGSIAASTRTARVISTLSMEKTRKQRRRKSCGYSACCGRHNAVLWAVVKPNYGFWLLPFERFSCILSYEMMNITRFSRSEIR